MWTTQVRIHNFVSVVPSFHSSCCQTNFISVTCEKSAFILNHRRFSQTILSLVSSCSKTGQYGVKSLTGSQEEQLTASNSAFCFFFFQHDVQMYKTKLKDLLGQVYVKSHDFQSLSGRT